MGLVLGFSLNELTDRLSTFANHLMDIVNNNMETIFPIVAIIVIGFLIYHYVN
ncbi:hypothetical protein AALK46_12885 [Staphylococcus nepalensis]|uniref:hypothetical protein n=1 Tax=Staphylococcus TaxID=1279 RepID=UPI002DBA2BD7|nr:hypothetical protein [Staphylococcus pseudoxylosus]MEB6038014.1 hypothetical protein [Staphylococcus pseudoxylosus]